MGRPEPDFSLSGLKTALRLEAEKVAPLSAEGGSRRSAHRLHAHSTASASSTATTAIPTTNATIAARPSRSMTRTHIVLSFTVEGVVGAAAHFQLYSGLASV